MAKRIIFTGAQGTGKSTVLNMFKEAGFPVITEVVRNMVKDKGIKINREGNDETQTLIFNEYKRVLSEERDYVSDRGLTDVLAYTIDGVADGNISTDVEVQQCEDIVNFVHDNEDVIWVYFPIEFPVVADGVRSTDEHYRETIDYIIHSLLKELEVNYLEVHGTPEERFKQIMDFEEDLDLKLYNERKTSSLHKCIVELFKRVKSHITQKNAKD